MEEFLKNYQENFVNNFISIAEENTASSFSNSEGFLRTLAINLYEVIFFSNDEDKFQDVLRKAFENELNPVYPLTKSLFILLKDFLDFTLESDRVTENVKDLKGIVERIERYVSLAERAFQELFEKVKKEREKERSLDEQFLNIFRIIKESGLEVKTLTFYKEVPVSCKADIVKIERDYVALSLENCSYLKAFLSSDYVFLKIKNAPKPIKAAVLNVNPEKAVILLSRFRFEDIPQEKRKFVRVEPEEKITIQIIYGNRVISGIIRDISVGGVGVYTNEGELPKPGERVKLKFELEGNFFEIDGEVRYVIKEGKFYRMGIQFVSLTPGEEEKIAGYVINIQFNILRKLR